MAKRPDDSGLYRRGRRWWLRLYVPGKGKEYFPLVPIGETHATTSKEVARVLARRVRAERLEHGDAADAGIDSLLVKYQAMNALGVKAKQARCNAAFVQRLIDGQKIADTADLTTGAIQDHLVKLAADGLKPKTLWNHRAAISGFCGFLCDRGIFEVNPCQKIKTPKADKQQPRFLSPEEVQTALRVAVKHGVFVEVATAMYTGMRREELRRMMWTNVDFDNGIVRIPEAKGKRPRSIPISKKLQAVLRMQQKRTGQSRYVFPGRERRDHSGMRRQSGWVDAIKPLQQALPIFCELEGQSTGRGWHLLRHTFASRLAQAGVPIAKISAWLGHSDIRTTMIYAHLAPGHDKDIDRL